MTTYHSVIGSNYGDEGKGVTTHTLASSLSNSIVVKINGGCQAGHTVCLPDGRRHVFRQLGSGTFAGRPTFLSNHFLVNPMEFFHELDDIKPKLDKHMLPLQVYCDPRATIATPFDSFINILVEEYRGDDRHGSCGHGINETVERSLSFDCITMNDLVSETRNDLRVRLSRIRDLYLPQRIRTLTDDDFDWVSKIDPLVLNDDFIEQLLNAYGLFTSMVKIMDVKSLVTYRSVIFEHSQGLLLDQNNLENFPHVTRSNTGIANAEDVCKQLSVSRLQAYYVTRGYLTRHGAGPLPREVTEPLYDTIVDRTNVTNPHQGHLRFAPLDLDKLSDTISNDLLPSSIRVEPTVVVSCVDQLPEQQCTWVENGKTRSGTRKQFMEQVREVLGQPIRTISSPCGGFDS